MRDDFCAFILTHGRADRVITYDTLKRCGYTGKIYIVIDNEDKQADQYRAKYGDKVLMFDKAAIAKTFDEGDNFNDRRAIIYARNACWDLARHAGCRYFIQLDDDYTKFIYKFNDEMMPGEWGCKNLDNILESFIRFLDSSKASSVALSQNGDHLGGAKSTNFKAVKTKRKAMNSFICDVERPFKFFGRINEDVNTYTAGGRRGLLFFTVFGFSLNQKQTQSNAGGMTDLYLDSGTYIKSFYSVMYCPSSVHVGVMGQTNKRLHHRINWNATAPKIISDVHRKLLKYTDAHSHNPTNQPPPRPAADFREQKPLSCDLSGTAIRQDAACYRVAHSSAGRRDRRKARGVFLAKL